MLTLAPLIAACVRRLDAGLTPSDDDLAQLDRALSGDLDEDDLVALARLIGDRRRAAPFGPVATRLRDVLEERPAVRARCEREVDVPALRSEPAHAPREQDLVGLYAWTEQGDETSFARTNTTLLRLAADGRFGRSSGGVPIERDSPAEGLDAGDRGVWSSSGGRLLMASDCGRHESYAYVRNARSLVLTDDEGLRRLLSPIVDKA